MYEPLKYLGELHMQHTLYNRYGCNFNIALICKLHWHGQSQHNSSQVVALSKAQLIPINHTFYDTPIFNCMRVALMNSHPMNITRKRFASPIRRETYQSQKLLSSLHTIKKTHLMVHFTNLYFMFQL